MGTVWVAWVHICNGRVPGHKLAPEGLVGTKMVLRHVWKREWCPGTFGNEKGAQAHMGKRRVPRHILPLKWCRVTYRH